MSPMPMPRSSAVCCATATRFPAPGCASRARGPGLRWGVTNSVTLWRVSPKVATAGALPTTRISAAWSAAASCSARSAAEDPSPGSTNTPRNPACSDAIAFAPEWRLEALMAIATEKAVAIATLAAVSTPREFLPRQLFHPAKKTVYALLRSRVFRKVE